MYCTRKFHTDIYCLRLLLVTLASATVFESRFYFGGQPCNVTYVYGVYYAKRSYMLINLDMYNIFCLYLWSNKSFFLGMNKKLS